MRLYRKTLVEDCRGKKKFVKKKKKDNIKPHIKGETYS